MGMLYLKDETVMRVKIIATEERRTPNVVIEMLLEDRENRKKTNQEKRNGKS